MSRSKRDDGNGEEIAHPPAGAGLPELRDAAHGCQACPLWKNATQTVFGEGARGARILFVGEQPGNEEDLSGHPFVGPAGRVLDAALQEAGIDRTDTYVTNVVKHFKWEPRGKRRLHQKPNLRETKACLPWLKAEIDAVKPEVVVCLGATAAQALLGRDFRVSKQRGQPMRAELADNVVATVHPSSILRAQTSEDRAREMSAFVADLRAVKRWLATRARKPHRERGD
jgi:uracil-DNA glycosylase family protein